jgi:hypothetical protein
MKKFALFFICFLLLSCHKDDPVPTCGCDSPTINTVNNQTGVLKKNSGDFKTTVFDSEFYIESINGSFSSYSGICNPSNLNGIVVPENVAVNVTFSGDIKKICNTPNSIPEVSYTDIKLTQIQKK